MATLKNTTVNDSGHITVPVGTVAQRPASPVVGMMRICTNFPGFTSSIVEYYDGTDWKSLYTPSASGSGGTEVTNSGNRYHTFTSNGTFTVALD
jgi:hypothetical protein